MQAIWNAVAYLKINAMFWMSLSINMLLITGQVNYWFDLEWSMYAAQLIGILLFIASVLGSRDKKVCIALGENGLRYQDAAKNYEVEIANEDIDAIRLRNYLLFKTLIIDISGNRRLALSNVAMPDDFLVHARAKLSAPLAVEGRR